MQASGGPLPAKSSYRRLLSSSLLTFIAQRISGRKRVVDSVYRGDCLLRIAIEGIYNSFARTQMQVNLSGPQGNAFVIGGMALDVAKRLGRTETQIQNLKARFRSGTYNDLLNTIDLEFPYLYQFVNDPRSAAEQAAMAMERDRRFPAFLAEVAAAERRQKQLYGPDAVL